MNDIIDETPYMVVLPENVLNIDWIIKNAEMIHYFGLGFIQIKLQDSRRRIHYYSDQLPITVGEEEIHNHRYDFSSEIVKGILINKRYEIVDGDSHILCDESCDPNNKIISEDKLVGIKLVHHNEYRSLPNFRVTYAMRHNVFHTVSSKDAITVLHRSEYKKDYAQVIRPIGADLVCPFSENLKMSKLLEHIEYLIEK